MNLSLLAVLLGSLSLFLALLLILLWLILQIAAKWRIFTKAGQAGWKSLIPVYSTYTQFKITWSTGVFWFWLALGIVNLFFNTVSTCTSEDTAALMESFPALVRAAIQLQALPLYMTLSMLAGTASFVLSLFAMYKLSRAFGHGFAFTFGLVVFGPIFNLILAFGKSEYRGPQ